ncbi:CoA ester lyase, partial [Sulfolobus sp. B1]
MIRRSQLYVPSISEKMIRKSVELNADSIIFDLEDAVPPEDKERAREIL